MKNYQRINLEKKVQIKSMMSYNNIILIIAKKCNKIITVQMKKSKIKLKEKKKLFIINL